MKLSIFTTITKPEYWQYAWKQAIKNYLDVADEVVVVYGAKEDEELFKDFKVPDNKELTLIYDLWPYEFEWSDIARHFNKGLEACTGDWAMKCDIDYFIHENDIKTLRVALHTHTSWMACSFMKFTVLNRFRAYQKVHMPFIINKSKMGDTIKFGIATNQDTAWGYPVLVKGFNTKHNLPEGTLIDESHVRSTGVDVWNYDNFFRSKEITAENFLRFSRAREKSGFGYTWGETKEQALKMFCNMASSRVRKTEGTFKPLTIDSHPARIRKRIRNMNKWKFGFNNWNNFE